MIRELAKPKDLQARLIAEAESREERRALLSFWASDINAVPDHPPLRQLPDGAIVHIDDLFDALRSLDDVVPEGTARDMLYDGASEARV